MRSILILIVLVFSCDNYHATTETSYKIIVNIPDLQKTNYYNIHIYQLPYNYSTSLYTDTLAESLNIREKNFTLQYETKKEIQVQGVVESLDSNGLHVNSFMNVTHLYKGKLLFSFSDTAATVELRSIKVN